MYRDQVPAYGYELGCGGGHAFRSHTPSVADEDGRHWFACRKCRTFVGIPGADLVEHRPQRSAADTRRLGDGELARRMDKAIHKDRIAPRLRATWGSVSIADLAAELNVPAFLVRTVAEDIGVYRNLWRGLAAQQTD